MAGLPADTRIGLAVWLAIGLVIYFAYGARHSRVAESMRRQPQHHPRRAEGLRSTG